MPEEILTGLHIFNRTVLLFHREMYLVHLGRKRRSTGIWEHKYDMYRYISWDAEGGERTDLPLDDESAKLTILYLPYIECSGAVMIF